MVAIYKATVNSKYISFSSSWGVWNLSTPDSFIQFITLLSCIKLNRSKWNTLISPLNLFLLWYSHHSKWHHDQAKSPGTHPWSFPFPYSSHPSHQWLFQEFSRIPSLFPLAIHSFTCTGKAISSAHQNTTERMKRPITKCKQNFKKRLITKQNLIGS